MSLKFIALIAENCFTDILRPGQGIWLNATKTEFSGIILTEI